MTTQQEEAVVAAGAIDRLGRTRLAEIDDGHLGVATGVGLVSVRIGDNVSARVGHHGGVAAGVGVGRLYGVGVSVVAGIVRPGESRSSTSQPFAWKRSQILSWKRR